MTRKKWLASTFAVALTTGAGLVVAAPNAVPHNAAPGNATPQAENGARNNRREWLQNLTPEQREQIRQRMQNITPEQREQRRVEQMQRMFAQAGVTDAAMQKAITDFVANEQAAREAGREAINQAGQKLSQAIRTNAVTNAQLSTLLGEYQAAGQEEKARREAAARSLNKLVNYTKNPRLEALLTTLGIVGDAALYAAPGLMGGGGPVRGGLGAGLGQGAGGAGGRGMAREGRREERRGGRGQGGNTLPNGNAMPNGNTNPGGVAAPQMDAAPTPL